MRQGDLDDMPLDVLMRRWPATIRVFLDRRMLCVGCPVASFHTLTDAAFEHRLDRDELEAAIIKIIAETEIRS